MFVCNTFLWHFIAIVISFLRKMETGGFVFYGFSFYCCCRLTFSMMYCVSTSCVSLLKMTLYLFCLNIFFYKICKKCFTLENVQSEKWKIIKKKKNENHSLLENASRKHFHIVKLMCYVIYLGAAIRNFTCQPNSVI